MNQRKNLFGLLLLSSLLLILFLLNSCTDRPAPHVYEDVLTLPVDTMALVPEPDSHPVFIEPITVEVGYNVTAKRYFAFMDSLLAALDSVGGFKLDEYLLVRANPWILDTLRHTDYYFRMDTLGEFCEDPQALIFLRAGSKLVIPDSVAIVRMNERMAMTVIDVNVPEFKLRIREGDTVLYTFDVRVGRRENKFLSMAGRVVNLETPIGVGEIVRINKAPWFINPVDGKRYHKTRRDDGRYTKLPGIPWIEPAINGIRQGALIHPTTNRSTLGKSISNGCVGAAEGAMWVVYYHAPLGTKVIYRYDLEIVTASGDTLIMPDIYNRLNSKGKSK
jgi:hypothetical protein